METYKAKIYPGKFLDVLLSLCTPLSLALVFFAIYAASEKEWEIAITLLIVPAFVFFISRLFRRRLHINIFAVGIDIHYLPQLFVQPAKTVHISFTDVAGCDSAKIKIGRYTSWHFILSLKSGKRYRFRSWIPAFTDVTTYATNCETDIATAFREYKRVKGPA